MHAGLRACPTRTSSSSVTPPSTPNTQSTTQPYTHHTPHAQVACIYPQVPHLSYIVLTIIHSTHPYIRYVRLSSAILFLLPILSHPIPSYSVRPTASHLPRARGLPVSNYMSLHAVPCKKNPHTSTLPKSRLITIYIITPLHTRELRRRSARGSRTRPLRGEGRASPRPTTHFARPPHRAHECVGRPTAHSRPE